MHTYGVTKQAHNLGFSQTEVNDAILNLEKENFYHSITENINHRIWQDVYKKVIKKIPIYIKFQITDDQEFLLRTFKKDESS